MIAMTLDTDDELLCHLAIVHHQILEPVMRLLPNVEKDPEDSADLKLLSAYNEAISVACRRGSPVASCAIDRHCLYNYAMSLEDDNIQTLVCLCCVR